MSEAPRKQLFGTRSLGAVLAIAVGSCQAPSGEFSYVAADGPRVYAGDSNQSLQPGTTGPEWARFASGRIELHGYFLEDGGRWPKAQDGSTQVAVCWENAAKSNDADRYAVRLAIEESWQAHSRLRFFGWGSCVAGSKGIKVFIEDLAEQGPRTLGLGYQLNKVPSKGMTLNFTFQNWGTMCAESESSRMACIKSIAVHEFGHAIGFAHEHNRHDRPGECMRPRQGTDGDTILTPYDPESAMNYCNPKYNNDGVLSVNDIKSVQLIYGAR